MYVMDFIIDEDGLETIEYLGITLAGVALLAIIYKLTRAVAGKKNTVINKINNLKF